MEECLFCKFASKKLATQIVYEDEDLFAFNDISPKAKVHILLIPKRHITSMLETQESDQELLGNLMLKANKIAMDSGLQAGYKLQINCGVKGGQEIPHLHLHIIGNP